MIHRDSPFYLFDADSPGSLVRRDHFGLPISNSDVERVLAADTANEHEPEMKSFIERFRSGAFRRGRGRPPLDFSRIVVAKHIYNVFHKDIRDAHKAHRKNRLRTDYAACHVAAARTAAFCRLGMHAPRLLNLFSQLDDQRYELMQGWATFKVK